MAPSPATATISSTGQVVTANFDGSYVRTSAIIGSVEVGGNGIPGVSIAIGGMAAAGTITDTNGAYSFSGLRAGSYTVEMTNPNSASYDFGTTSASVTLATGASEVVTFEGSLVTTASISGALFIDEFSKDGNRQAREMFELAVALDPTYSRGHVGFAISHRQDYILGFSDDPERSIAQCIETAQRAVSLDDADAVAHFALSRGLDYAGRIDQGLHEAKLAIELNPNDANCYGSLGALLISAGQSEEGIAALRPIRQLNPKDPAQYLSLTVESRGHFIVGRYDEAATVAKDGRNRRPGDPVLRVLLAASLGNVGRGDEARSVLAQGEPIDPAFLDQPWARVRFRGIDPERLVDGLRKAGWEG